MPAGIMLTRFHQFHRRASNLDNPFEQDANWDGRSLRLQEVMDSEPTDKVQNPEGSTFRGPLSSFKFVPIIQSWYNFFTTQLKRFLSENRPLDRTTLR